MRRSYFVSSAAVSLLLSSVSLFVTACGSSASASGGGGGGQQLSEFLYGESIAGTVVFSIDAGTGKLTKIQDLPSSGSTSTEIPGLVTSPTTPTQFVFAISGDGSGVNSFTVGSDGTLTLVQGSPFPLPSTFEPLPNISALAIDPSGSVLYATDSGQNLIAEFQINPYTGSLNASSVGFDPLQSGVSFPEQAVVLPGGNYLYATDEYINSVNPDGDQYAGISAFSIDPSGSLSLIADSPSQLPSSSQPGQIVATPDGSFVYAALTNNISYGPIAGFSVNATTGALTPIAGSPFPSNSPSFTQTYSLAMHPSGKFLYAFNLNGNSISAFAINSSTGALTPVNGSPFAGQDSIYQTSPTVATQGPIAIDPSGNFLYALCFDSEVAFYQIDQESGALSIPAGSPAAIPTNLFSIAFGQAP